MIANAEIDGEPLADLEMLGHYVIIATAGHDTTSNAIGGGLLALARAAATSSSCCRRIPS